MPYRSKAPCTAVTSTKAVLDRQFDGLQRIVWRMTQNKCKAQA
jgi:hypothetical protein